MVRLVALAQAPANPFSPTSGSGSGSSDGRHDVRNRGSIGYLERVRAGRRILLFFKNVPNGRKTSQWESAKRVQDALEIDLFFPLTEAALPKPKERTTIVWDATQKDTHSFRLT